MLYYVLATVYVVVCLLMIVVILLQQGRGDVASAFGGAGTQTAFGARQGATVLTKATTVLGALFMIGALLLAVVGQRGPGSLLRGLGAPKPSQEQSAPAKPAPQTPPASQQQGEAPQDKPAAQPPQDSADEKPASKTPADEKPAPTAKEKPAQKPSQPPSKP